MTEVISRPIDHNGHVPDELDPLDLADQAIFEAMNPLMFFADACPVMVELMSEHLLARFGHADDPNCLPAATVAKHWQELVSFVLLYQKMLIQDQPDAMSEVALLHEYYPRYAPNGTVRMFG